MEDLFQNLNLVPTQVKNVCEKYSYMFPNEIPFNELNNFLNELELLGYTFEYGLDCVPFGLRPIK